MMDQDLAMSRRNVKTLQNCQHTFRRFTVILSLLSVALQSAPILLTRFHCAAASQKCCKRLHKYGSVFHLMKLFSRDFTP